MRSQLPYGRSGYACLGASRVILALALALAAAPAGANDPAREPEAPGTEAPAGPAAAPVEGQPAVESGIVTPESPGPGGSELRQSRPLRPMIADLMAVMDEERRQMEGLRERLQRAIDHASALSVQREIEQLKKDTELRMLRIQADYARREGRLDDARRIETSIEEILAPRPRAVPAARPAPTGTIDRTQR